MNVELKRVAINDIDEIIKMQKESFKPLLDKYEKISDTQTIVFYKE